MKCYNINNVAMMTGFTTRTIRNYIKMGLLNGNKENGIWQFTAENLEEFFTNPNITAALNSKRNAQVFDFLADDKKQVNSVCVILDLHVDQEVAEKTIHFFCDEMCSDSTSNVKMASYREGGQTRIILSGVEEVITNIMKKYDSTLK